MTDRPPIRGVVMIVADQLHAGHLGHAGNPDVSTPHLDRLAAQSTRFTNAFVANPTCMPNRATIATGRMPSAIGSRTNGIPFDPRAANFVAALRDAGWSTGAAGKLHYQPMEWPFEPHELADIERVDPLLLDVRSSNAVATGLAPGWDRWESFADNKLRWVELPDPYYGFERVDLVVGHGDRPSGHYWHWAYERGVDLAALGGYDNAVVKLDSWDEVWQSRVPAEAHPTAYTRDHVIAQLRAGAADDRPFMIFGSFPDPHHPFCPPEPYWSMFDPTDVTLPSTFDAEHVNPVPHIEAMFAERGQPRDATACWAPDETQMRAVLAAQYGQVTFIDDAIGAILDEIDELGLTDQVAVIFTTDHGDMMGEHGLLLKQTVQYPAITRVPLIMSVPGADPAVDERLVQSTDIAPTILELANLVPYRGIQGRNLLDPTPIRDALLIEEEYPFGIEALPAPINIRSVVTDRGRLTVYDGQSFGELYDHDADPDELVNRFDDPACGDLRAEMFEALTSLLIDAVDRGRAPAASA